MAKKTSEQPKKKHHHLKKLLKLAALAGVAYGAKKLLEKQKRGGSTGAR